MKIKKQTSQKCVSKQLKFENCKSCLEATQVENEKNYVEKNKIDIDSIKELFNKSINQ